MSKIIKIVAFDPSTTEMGYCYSEYNLEDKKLTVPVSGVIYGHKLLKNKKDMLKTFNRVFTTLDAIEEETTRLLFLHTPDHVVSESAFVHKFANAYASLVLAIHTLRRACKTYFFKDIFTYAPKEMKLVITGKGGADKILVEKAIKNNENIILIADPKTSHEYDAIGIAYTFVKKYIEG